MKLFQRSNNAIFIDNLLINIPKDIDKELDITNVLLSNELVIDKETLLRLEAKDVNFYCLKETFFALNTNKPELYNIIDTDFKIGNIKIKAFITKCSLRSDIKNISFKIKDVLYCAYATDIPNVPTTCLIVDATFSGTETYKQILKQSNTNLINMTILINDNKTYLMDNALLNNYWDLNKVSKDLKVMLAKDELEYIVPKKQTLSSIKLGKLCQKIKQNKIILSTEQTLNSKQIYTDNRFAYGVLQLKTKTPISDKWFNTNKLLHNMTNIERNLRFNDSQLYAYTFDIVEEYEPIKIEHLGLFDTMFDKIIFTDVIKDIYTYNVKDRCNRNLSRDHELIHAWYIKKKTQTVKYPLEDIINLHVIITKELNLRNIEHNILEDLDKVCITDNIPEKFKSLDNIIISDEIISLSTNQDFDNVKLLFKKVDILSELQKTVDKLNIPITEMCAKDYIPLYDLVLIKKPLTFKTQNSFNIQLCEIKRFDSFEALLTEMW